MVYLSAFADEVTQDFIGQLEYLVSENIGYIEPRFIDGKNIMDLTEFELKEAKKKLNDHNLKVSAIGSPIGKVVITESFGPHLDKFKHAVQIALQFETKFIRVFSYYAPEGAKIVDYRDEVIERMARKAEVLKDVDVKMVHENEGGIYGETAKRCVDIIESVNSPKLRLVYDPANLVWHDKIKDNIQSCWPLMKPYVSHVHIKDWRVDKSIGSIPGHGDAQIELLLLELTKMNYSGCLTMEPHLEAGGQFGGQTGPELYSKAVNAVRQLAEKNKLDLM